GTFGAEIGTTVPASSLTFAMADVNGDRRDDLLLAAPPLLAVLLSRGRDGFSPPVDYQVGGPPRPIMTGVFDGNGVNDVAVLNRCSESTCRDPGVISILLGRGDGTFSAGESLDPGGWPDVGTTADFNRDGHTDIVVSNGCFSSY